LAFLSTGKARISPTNPPNAITTRTLLPGHGQSQGAVAPVRGMARVTQGGLDPLYQYAKSRCEAMPSSRIDRRSGDGLLGDVADLSGIGVGADDCSWARGKRHGQAA